MVTDRSLPESTRIGRVVLQVADLDRSLAFYAEAIGFGVVAQGSHNGQRVAELGVAAPLADVRGDESSSVSVGSHGAALIELREQPGVRPVPRRGRVGIYHFAVLLPSRADLGRFVGHCAGRAIPMASSDHLISEATYLVDPDGITMEVYRDRPRSEWTIRGGEILADTLPMHVAAVVEAGGDEPWRGIPTGTTMGHMHFYVRDLSEANAFYHDALGFDRVLSSFPGMLFVSAGGYHHHVGLNTWAAGSPVATHEDARLLYWELVLPTEDDVARVRERVERAGFSARPAAAGDRAQSVSGAGVSAFEADDPWGIRVRVSANG